jgi:ribosomal-protein-alanine N-acetyltransferase
VHKIVTGQKTWLRPASWGFSEDELHRRYQWSLDDDLQYWSGTIPGGRSYTQFKDTVLERDWPSDGRRISYAIFTSNEGMIGMVSCYGIDWQRGVGEIGVYLGIKSLWGRGYGTDALRTFLRHLFTNLDFTSVYLHTYESNVRAQRSYSRIGFEVVDKRRRYSARIGYHDELRMSIARERFEQLNRSRETAASL